MTKVRLVYYRLKTLPSIIRFEEWDQTLREELIYNLQGRVLELRSFLYRNFVYYAIYHGAEDEMSPDIVQLVQKAVACSFHIIQSKPTKRRHHGSWFASRNVLCSALLILAAVKAGGIVDYLVDWPDLAAQAIGLLGHWASEAPDLAQAKGILEKLVDLVSEESTPVYQ